MVTKRVATQVFETSNLDQFEEFKANRPINPTFVRKLARAINAENHLRDFPVVCKRDGKKLIVKDGQHRLAAARTLKTPIFYMVTEDEWSLQNVIDVNTKLARLDWKWEDYINAYSVLGKKDYEHLRVFHEKYRLPYSMCISLLMGHNSSMALHTRDEFQRGNFKITAIEGAERVGDIVLAFDDHHLKGLSHHMLFVMAICRLCLLPRAVFDEGRLLAKLENHSAMLRKQGTLEQYIEMLDEFYNRSVQRRNYVSLRVEIKKLALPSRGDNLRKKGSKQTSMI